MALTHLDRPSTRAAPSGPDDQVVLCVEDDVIQQAHLAEVLTRHGYRVEVASSGADVELVLRDTSPHTVLLDLGLPDIDGVELCRRLAVWPGSPIVVVSADSDEDRIVAALDAGACDYVIKPFDVGVLLARLRVARREREAGRRVPDDDVITVGDLTLDIGAHQVWTGEDAVELYPRPFAVLEVLMRNEGALLSYATLAGRRRGDAVPDAELKALRIAVSRIRKAIGTGPDRPVVLTEPRIGYRLVRADA